MVEFSSIYIIYIPYFISKSWSFKDGKMYKSLWFVNRTEKQSQPFTVVIENIVGNALLKFEVKFISYFVGMCSGTILL